MDIRDLQGDFIDAIFGGDKKPAASHVIGDDILSAEQRFGIYKGSVHGILTQSLGLTFPVCKALVGDEFFDNMIGLFIDKHPPSTSFFAEYGNKLPEFLESFEPVKDISYLVDTVKLEWARHEVWHQKKANTVNFAELGNLSEEQQVNVVFKLTDTLRLIESNYRIDDIWFAHQDDENAEPFESIEINHAVKLFVYKDDESLKISLMSQTEEDSLFWDFINAISKGNNLGILAEDFGDALPEQLNQAIQGGWIQSFQL